MSLETSIEALACALQAHAGAIEKLAAAMAASHAANAERFAPAGHGDWEAGGCEDVEKGIPVKPGEDPSDPPFEPDAEPQPRKSVKKSAEKSAPAAEQAAAGKIPEEKSKPVEKEPEPEKESAPLTLENARSLASSVLKKKGADKLRGLLDAVGVKKLSALNTEQIRTFCANAEQALREA